MSRRLREAMVLSLLLAGPRLALADPYEDALAGARLAAETGRFSAAAQALAEPAATWPQDFPLQLTRAYYLLRAGAYQDAEAQYRVSLALEPGSPEARRGLADARLGRGAPDRLWVGLAGSGTTFSGQASRSSFFTGALTVDALVADRWLAGGLYRALGSTSSLTGGGPGRSGSTGGTSSIQHEGHLWLGLAEASWQLRLHAAAIGGSAVTRAGVEQVYGYRGVAAGVSALLLAGLEWRASAVTSWYEDLTVSQLEGTATLPVGDQLALRVGGRTQLGGGEPTAAALAAVEWRGPLDLALRGEYGLQRRPADLEAHVLYDLPEELRWAARLQVGYLLGHRTRAWLGADLEGWRGTTAPGAPAGQPQPELTATRFSGGLTISF